MKLVGLPFANTFTFARASAAAMRNAAGTIVDAPADVPRFDHDAEGNRLGLLVESGAWLGQQDGVASVAGDWSTAATATVMLEWMEADGSIKRRASYTRGLKTTVDGLLSTVGHLRYIAAVAGFITPQRRSDGSLYVRYSERSWELGSALVDDAGVPIADNFGRLMIESS